MEQWKPVVGFESSYEVSDLGRIRSLDRIVRGKNGGAQRRRGIVLSPGIGRGYPMVSLKGGAGKSKTICVHRLVMQSFVGECPEGYEVAHGDGVRTNNKLSNLRYDTRKGNHADKLTHGTWQGGENNPAAKLNALKVRAISQLVALGWSHATLAEIFGVDQSTISLIKRGKKWGHITNNGK